MSMSCSMTNPVRATLFISDAKPARADKPIEVISPDAPDPDASDPDAPARDDDPLLTCQGEAILDADRPCPGDGWEPEEEELYRLINDYRQQHGLPVVPRSPILTLVANRHVRDMDQNIGYLTHSWSDCRYDAADPSTYACSSRAPRRLGTRFRSRAYENAHFNPAGATALSAFRGWTSSPDHNALLLNLSNWHDNEWESMGIGIYRQFAVLWVSEQRDRSRN